MTDPLVVLRERIIRLARFGIVDGRLTAHPRGTVVVLDDVLRALDSIEEGARGLDVERLARAMRWAGIRSEPDFPTIEDAARQLAGDYASSLLDRATSEVRR
jgi:hypothetical protein